MDPLLLPAVALAALLIHQRRTAGIDFLVAIVGGRVCCLEACVPCGDGGIAGRG